MKLSSRRGLGTSTGLAALVLAAALVSDPVLGSSAAAQESPAPATGTVAPTGTAVDTSPQPATQPAQTAPASGATPSQAEPGAAPSTDARPAAVTPPPGPDTASPAPTIAEPAATPPQNTAAQDTNPQEKAAENTTATAPDFLPQSMRETLTPMLAARDPNLPHDLSPLGMFMAADWVVKAVMIGLAIASVITWTVLVVKLLELVAASRRAQAGIRRVEHAPSLPAALASVGSRRDPVSRMVRAAAGEYDRSAPALDRAGDAGVKERVGSHLDRIQAAAGRRMGRGTGVLATIGSTAPFVGLFGTVWGIMNSFIGISEAQTTNLAVVAPGIAEALLATAIGLVAAIPAVVIYNVFARAITGYRLRLANAAAGVGRLVSRDLDFRGSAAVAGE
ncbi:tonB-system energizer ExbB [Paracoccus mangrovi]|uniref:Biopolymer transport protein ExbB n=1 Tax=Paracoccus mangrovi TaxID=1715645 RepID=A0ABV7R405_9RHOB